MKERFVLPTGYPSLIKEGYRYSDVMTEAMSKIGCVEILPSEREMASEIKWSSYLARTALRLGEKGRYIFDPDNKLDIEAIKENPLFLNFRYDLSLALNGGDIDFSHSLLDSDATYVRGIIRRIIAHPRYRQVLREALKYSSENLYRLWAVIEREQKKDQEQPSEKPAVLAVAHKCNAQTGTVVEKAIGERLAKGQTLKRVSQFLGDLVNGTLSFVSTPYMGAATVLAEAEETGKIGKVEIVDYNEVLTTKTDKFLDRHNPKYAFITGVVSFDARNLRQIIDKFQKRGMRSLVGGLTATIDPEVIIQSTSADVFLGESEGTMDSILEVYAEANDNQRFIFHRDVPVEFRQELKVSGKKYLVKENPRGYLDVFIDVPPSVDLSQSYSSEKERSGFLARRIKYQEMMNSPISFFGRQWERSVHAIRQMETSRFCPWRCHMCSTVRAIGQKPRRMPVESLSLFINSLETDLVLVTDQNFGAKGKKEPQEEWESWMLDFFRMMKHSRASMACQSELAFFGNLTSSELRSLAKQTMVAVLSGLEMPAQLKGAKAKNPRDFAALTEIPREMKIVVIGTAIAGLPNDYLTKNSPLPSDYSAWKIWLSAIKPDILIVFPNVAIPGSPGVPNTEPESADPLEAYKGFTLEIDRKDAGSLSAWYASLGKIIERQLKIRDYRFNRKLFVLLANLSIFSIYQFKLSESTVARMAYPEI